MATQQALEVAKTLARMAAERILLYYGDAVDTKMKSDTDFESPVTQADTEADAQILRGLRQAYPDHAYLTEESSDTSDRQQAEYVWVVDPLDGTKEFIRGGSEFTVNIALLADDTPILGVIVVPAQNTTYWGIVGEGAYRRVGDKEAEQISVSDESELTKMKMVCSKSHQKPEEKQLFKQAGFSELSPAGSSVKGCKVAQGTAHVYPRFGRLMEWDICAMTAILEAAGGKITDLEGNDLVWNKPNPEVLGFVASNGTSHEKIIDCIKGLD